MNTLSTNYNSKLYIQKKVIILYKGCPWTKTISPKQTICTNIAQNHHQLSRKKAGIDSKINLYISISLRIANSILVPVLLGSLPSKQHRKQRRHHGHHHTLRHDATDCKRSTRQIGNAIVIVPAVHRSDQVHQVIHGRDQSARSTLGQRERLSRSRNVTKFPG